MGYNSPVFFLPVEDSELPEAPNSWSDVLPILSDRWARQAEVGLRSTTSRNWWHQDALDQVCRGLGIEGLEFILSEVACLCGHDLDSASLALDEVLHQISTELPPLGEHEVNHGSVWWMREHKQSGSFVEAFEQARPAYDSSASVDVGFEAMVAFCSFVKSLRQTVKEAQDQKCCVLYVQTQS